MQKYYIGYAQDEWHVRPEAHAELRRCATTTTRRCARRTTCIVKFNIDTGVIDPNTTPLYKSKKNNFQPRVGADVCADGEDGRPRPASASSSVPARRKIRFSRSQSRPRQHDAVERSVPRVSDRPGGRDRELHQQPEQPLVSSRARTRTSTRFPSASSSTPRRCSRSSEREWPSTAAYVGSQGRNLFLRSVANQITQVVTNPNPANAAFVVREFSIVQRDAAGNITGVQNPYAEIDYKTSGGHDNYNAMQLG